MARITRSLEQFAQLKTDADKEISISLRVLVLFEDRHDNLPCRYLRLTRDLERNSESAEIQLSVYRLNRLGEIRLGLILRKRLMRERALTIRYRD